MIKKHPIIFTIAGVLIYTVIDDHIKYTKFFKEHSQWKSEREKRTLSKKESRQRK
jgi:hypothetical protein